jgi:hypothetical protein
MTKSTVHSSLIGATILLLISLTACQKFTISDQQSENNTNISSSNLRSGSLPVISLKVTVSEADASGIAYNITSDGKGDYLNGVDYVQAVLDQYGTFAFNTFNPAMRDKQAVAKRWVTYNFNNPVDPGNTYRPDPSNSKNYHFSTGGSTYGTNPVIPLQNLGVNGNPSTECIYMGNGLGNSTTGWRVSFRKGCESSATSPTAFAVVTRTRVKATDGVDEWVIQPLGSCSPEANNNVAALRIDDGTSCTVSLKGYYYLPFYFTLKAQ